MECLQYNLQGIFGKMLTQPCFKPYYKWNTFNTSKPENEKLVEALRFKPYYKWNTFNT